MGKNAGHKAGQAARFGGDSGAADGDAARPGPAPTSVDATFHTPAWHAARLAAMTNVDRVSWEDFKRAQKAEAAGEAASEAVTEEAQRAFRAQLDADREKALAGGSNQAGLRAALRAKEKKKGKKEKKERKEKKEKKGKPLSRRSRSRSRDKRRRSRSRDRDRDRRRRSWSSSSSESDRGRCRACTPPPPQPATGLPRPSDFMQHPPMAK